jgi:hypothetical protein
LTPLPAVVEEHTSGSRRSVEFRLEESLAVPPGENRVFLLDVFLPPGSGKLGSTIVARFGTERDEKVGDLHIRIDPYSFDLPQVPSLATAFGMQKDQVIRTHERFSEQPFDSDALHLAYLSCLAEHRISVYFPGPGRDVESWPDTGEIQFDWSDFDRLTGGMLDGSLFPGIPPATSARIPRLPGNLDRKEVIRFYREFASRARRKGWLDRMFYYLPDEPMRRDYSTVREIASLLREADPGIRTLATEPFSKQLEGFVDIWCPDVTAIGDSIRLMPLAFKSPHKVYLDWQFNPPPSSYRQRKTSGETAWFYTCMSAQYLDYPNLFIDSNAASHRVIPWLAFRYGFSGLLYYNVVRSYAGDNDPWISQYQFMANGDGNLLYPGLPELPNIDTHQPIPSLRLKLLREGIEDYEYLRLYEQRADSSRATEMAARVARRSVQWEHDISALVDVRNKLAEAIEGED